MNTKRTYATGAVECTGCGEVVEFEVPVSITVAQEDGSWVVRAKVDDSQDWQQPVWDHVLTAHGPEDPT